MHSKALDVLYTNLNNGNLKTARRQAQRFSIRQIRGYLMDEESACKTHTFRQATLCAEYLKTGEGWQEYCDAM